MKRNPRVTLAFILAFVVSASVLAAAILGLSARQRRHSIIRVQYNMAVILSAIGFCREEWEGARNVDYLPRSRRWEDKAMIPAYGDGTFSNSTDYFRWLVQDTTNRPWKHGPSTSAEWNRTLSAPGVPALNSDDWGNFTSNNNPFCVVADINSPSRHGNRLPDEFPVIFTRNISITGMSERATLLDIPPFGDRFALVMTQSAILKIVTKESVGEYFAQFGFPNYRVLRPEDTYPPPPDGVSTGHMDARASRLGD